jgi:hypothetical protein
MCKGRTIIVFVEKEPGGGGKKAVTQALEPLAKSNKVSFQASVYIYTVKLVQGGIARDRTYFPNWAIFRIIQNCKKKLKIN